MIEGLSVSKTSHHVHHVVSARLQEVVARHDLRLHHDGHIERDVENCHGSLERGRGDADDDERTAIDVDGSADDARIASEPCLPKGVTEESDGVRARAAVFLSREEGPSESGNDAVGLKQVGACDDSQDALAAPVGGEGHRREKPRGRALEHFIGAVAHVLVVRNGVGAVDDAGPLAIDLHQLFRTGDATQRAEKESVDG